jgi:hypothetical protein
MNDNELTHSAGSKPAARTIFSSSDFGTFNFERSTSNEFPN